MNDSSESTRPQPATSTANADLGTAQLMQYAAVGLVIAGVALLVMGHEGVLANWIAVVTGLPLIGASGALFWKGNGREAAANQLLKAEREAATAQPGDSVSPGLEL